MKRLRRKNGVLMLPLGDKEVPADLMSDAQFLDWVRLSQGFTPMLVDGRGRRQREIEETSDDDPSDS